jgi:putative phosphoesterase
MKIALFSDIHANLPAITAMFKSMDKHQPDAIYCLGDLVGYHVWPNEVIAEIRKRSIATLAGNHDLKPVNFPPISTEELAHSDAAYAYHIVGAKERNYLQTLPAHISLTYKIKDEKFNILMVHGSPKSVNEYVLEDTDENYVLNMMDEANADILFVGHTHLPYQRVLQNKKGEFKLIINIGSAGKPKDNNPKGAYVLMHIAENTSLKIKENLPQFEFIRFDYDIEKAANAIIDSPLPINLADRLMGGI